MRAARKDEVDTGFVHSVLQSDMQLPAPLRRVPACHPTPRYASRISVLVRLRVLPARPASTRDWRCSSHRSKGFAPVDRNRMLRAAPARRRESRERRDSRASGRPRQRRAPRRRQGHFPRCAAPAWRDGDEGFIADPNRHVAAVDRKLEIFAANVRRRAETESHRLARQAFPQ